MMLLNEDRRILFVSQVISLGTSILLELCKFPLLFIIFTKTLVHQVLITNLNLMEKILHKRFWIVNYINWIKHICFVHARLILHVVPVKLRSGHTVLLDEWLHQDIFLSLQVLPHILEKVFLRVKHSQVGSVHARVLHNLDDILGTYHHLFVFREFIWIYSLLFSFLVKVPPKSDTEVFFLKIILLKTIEAITDELGNFLHFWWTLHRFHEDAPRLRAIPNKPWLVPET